MFPLFDERFRSVPALRIILFAIPEIMSLFALRVISPVDVNILFIIKSLAEPSIIVFPLSALFTVRSPEAPLVFMSISSAAVIVPSVRS